MSGFRAPVDLKRLHVYRQGTSAGHVYVAGNFRKELAADPTVDPCTEYVGAYVPEKTCATCKHQRGILCGRIKVHVGDVARIQIHFQDEYKTRAFLQVDDTFGCVLHEEKEG